MPLSEHEERILAEIERQLAEDDPRLVARARRASQRSPHRLRWAIPGFVLGLACLLLLVVHVAFGFVGMALMFASVVVAVPEVQHRVQRRVEQAQADSDA